MVTITTTEMTVNDLGEILGVSRDSAYGLIGFLEEAKLVSKVEGRTKPNASGKGKGQNIYLVPDDLGSKLKILFDGGA